MSVASWSGSLLSWERELAALKDRLGLAVRRRELRKSIGHYVDGLLSGIERKTGWLLAERVGEARPHRLQALPGRGRWDAEAARDLVRGYAVEALADRDAVLAVDGWAAEPINGFLKKGTHSVGVAGRAENSQVGVFLAYASRYGQALIDVLYGSDKRLRVMLESRKQPYVLAVRSNERLMTTETGFATRDAAEIADAPPTSAWHRHAAGEGAKGPRLYDWARVRLLRLQEPPWDHWLLVRRSLRDAADRAY